MPSANVNFRELNSAKIWNYVATYGALIIVWTLIHRAYATMLNYVVHTGLFGLVTSVKFEHPTRWGWTLLLNLPVALPWSGFLRSFGADVSICKAQSTSRSCYLQSAVYVPKGHKTSDRGIDITSGYGNWLKLGSALADGLGEDGRAYYHDLRHMNGDYTYGYDNHSYSL